VRPDVLDGDAAPPGNGFELRDDGVLRHTPPLVVRRADIHVPRASSDSPPLLPGAQRA